MGWLLAAVSGACLWFIILLLPWRPWATAECLDAAPSAHDEDLSDITVLIPARNEAEVIGNTLSALEVQGRNLSVLVIDDQSADNTAAIVQQNGSPLVHMIPGESLPPGWNGKLWALEQGISHINTRLTLLIDADIELQAGIVSALRNKMREEGFQLVSLMAALRMENGWERLLMPSFIYFFKLLYPFRLSNSTRTEVAAAAGGCILLETRLIGEIGGFRALRGELIDDCALAKKVKSLGYRTWIGLTHCVRSVRRYDHLRDIWDMVARTAFCQLRYSILLLLLCTTLLLLAFWLPVAGLLFPSGEARVISASALAAMSLSYSPTLAFYGLSRWWVTALPLIATLYLAMTWTSALRWWQGEGAQWKGRSYRKRPK